MKSLLVVVAIMTMAMMLKHQPAMSLQEGIGINVGSKGKAKISPLAQSGRMDISYYYYALVIGK